MTAPPRSPVLLTPEQARDLATRTLSAIYRAGMTMNGPPEATRDADRERVQSDLDGLLHHGGEHYCCEPLTGSVHDLVACDDARRYSTGLRRTAALYGVTP